MYVDGFVLPVPKKNVKRYIELAKKAGKVWREHGALEYCECVGDDLQAPCGLPFPKLCKAKPGETIIFCYILYKSRAQRDRVNQKVGNDPRMAEMMDPKKKMPFDVKRMAYGGFEVAVDA